jgi:imidazolonepropionase-like amidohydrolase
VFLAWAVAAFDASATSDGALVLRNVTIVDIERNRLDPQRDVVIAGDRIVGIQGGETERAPKQGRVLDGRGKFLIPGLWGFQVHVFSAPGEEDFALPRYIVNGITGIRDAGALRTLPEQHRLAPAAERGECVGPRPANPKFL